MGFLVLLWRGLGLGVVAGAVAALAVVPAGAGWFIGFALYLLGGLGAVDAVAAINGIELILFDDVDELGGIIHVLGIAAVPEPLCPTAVVGHIQVLEHAVAGAAQELGMVQVGILGAAILAIADPAAERVALAIDLTGPVVRLDAEVVVGLLSHAALAGRTLQDALCQRDAGRNPELMLKLYRHGREALDIFQIILSWGL